MSGVNRRTFLAGATAATVALASRSAARAESATKGANNKVVLALMGANNRGSQLAEGFSKVPGVEFAYVCDCDEKALEKGVGSVNSHFGNKPKGVKDFRTALDDPAVDALVCAAPNHWHAAATILACAAGKHVYVEKPASQTADEGERMIAAARSNKRVVQVGLQRRSGPLYRKVAQRIGEGAIGRALYASSTYNAQRPTIGRGKQTTPPAWLDYDLWQGPATTRPYQDNLIHYNWHWFWHWGNGELGNNGVHTIDICRMMLGVDYPSRVTAAGAKLRYDDDQETPDTATATFDCDGRTVVWEGISWSRRTDRKCQIGIRIRGENGEIYVDDDGYELYDTQGKTVESDQLGRGDTEHLQNFLDGIREGKPLNADIEEGHKSTMFCHLGNIAYRTGQPLKVDSKTGHILENPAAEALWAREYRPGWIPAV
jgi:predicted dehydrogenase